MRQSELFTKTRKEAPRDEVSKNAKLLIKGGFIQKEMAGVYDLLPLGFRVIEKIKQIVREEMNSIGSQEMLMSTLQRKELWQVTDRWDDKNVDIWFKTSLKGGGEVGLGWSHEEPITDMMKNFIASYRDLPIYTYQFQTKLRNELRAKSGMMRGREFIMKDLYSYSVDEASHKIFYDRAIEAYKRVFERVGLGDRTFLTFASGGAFTQFSHEFQTLSDAGEDTIFIHRDKRVAINKEVLSPEVMKQLGVERDELEEVKAVEVGNIFSFGDIKSKQLGLFYKDKTGASSPVILGSYGIGITRLMGAIVEIFSDEKSMVWPSSIAPFSAHIILLDAKDAEASKQAEEVYTLLASKGIETLFDDREGRAGEKFADADLIGIPLRIIVSARTAKEGQLEVINRKEGSTEHVSSASLLTYFHAHV